MDRRAWRAAVHGVTESDMDEELSNSNNVSHILFRFLSLRGYIVPCAT